MRSSSSLKQQFEAVLRTRVPCADMVCGPLRPQTPTGYSGFTSGSARTDEIKNGFRNLSENKDLFDKKKPIFIKRNIYISKKLKTSVEDDGIFCSCSSSSNLCGIDCNCGDLLSSCSSRCKCKSDCTNKPFQKRHIKKMKLVQTEECGYGIVAHEDIKPGEFIVEFVGEVIDEKICKERLLKLNRGCRVETNFYLCQITWNMVIDATYKGNKSRFFNHSCNSNTEMQKWIIDGETRMGIFATRYINKGENLTYDYQFVQFGADQVCYCGALTCRKFLGAKPRKGKNMPMDKSVNVMACKAVTSKPSKTCSRLVIGSIAEFSTRFSIQRCDFATLDNLMSFSRKHFDMISLLHLPYH
ncbi:unnamed protein product [Cochlearia groenlandica]